MMKIVFLLCACAVALGYKMGQGSRLFNRAPLALQGAVTEDPTAVPVPGSPVIREINKGMNVAKMAVAISGDATGKAFQKSCELYNKEVVEREYSVPGFRKGAKLPPNYLYQMFGEANVKNLCGSLLAEEIQDECEHTGLTFVGRGRITNFNEDKFLAGKPHVIDIECDLWPEITYGSDRGYCGLECTAVKNNFDAEKYESVKQNIRERYKVVSVSPPGTAAAMGDVVKASMGGFESDGNGKKGAPLPALASGDDVEIPLEKGKFMDGLVEGLVGCVAGDERTLEVTFPQRQGGPGAQLSGQKAIFEVKVAEVMSKEIPEWNEALAARIRDNMTLEELEEEVRNAVESDSQGGADNNRNDAIAIALMSVAEVNKLSEALMEENTQQRFQQMLMEFKEQGTTDEQLAQMMTPEKYDKYKEISRPNVEKIVKLGMVFRDISEKENIKVTPEEVDEQLAMLRAQAKQKNEPPPNEQAAAEEIENVLLRRKVFDFLAEHATITYIDAPTDEGA